MPLKVFAWLHWSRWGRPLHLWGGPPVRSRRPRRLPRSLSIPESRAWAPGADQGIRPTKIQLFLEMYAVLAGETACPTWLADFKSPCF
jgi:hypothetical protein